MRGLSLRTRTLILSSLLAALIAGGTSFASYAIIVDAMNRAAAADTTKIAQAAGTVLREAVSEAEYAAAAGGDSGDAYRAAARAHLLSSLSSHYAQLGFASTGLALYDERLQKMWSSSPSAVLPAGGESRLAARSSGRIEQTSLNTTSVLGGLLGINHLSVSAVHIPVKLPGGGTGVLDVVYAPLAEEAVINGVRSSMLGLLVMSMFLMIVMMQSSMAWVLGLVDDLRRGADAIDAGRLHERLPVKGDDEIAALAQSVNGLIERLERRADAQSRFVADASHELATPVAGIRGYTSILRAWGADDPRVRDEAIDAIDRESRRMARLTGDLLNLLHADQGLVLKTERFDLNAMARQQLALSASRWLDKDIEYVGPDEAPLAMTGDPDRVEDVLSILLDNASKYTPVHGTISVTTHRRRDTVTFDVADTGQGIPEGDLAHVFDRFYRSEVSRAAGEGGFGLGLAIAKSIVASMGGEVSVASVVGHGTTFSVMLPRGRT